MRIWHLNDDPVERQWHLRTGPELMLRQKTTPTRAIRFLAHFYPPTYVERDASPGDAVARVHCSCVMGVSPRTA